MAITNRCEGFCQDARGGMWQCDVNGKVKRDGKWYCGTHDPVRKKEKADKREEAYQKKWARKEARWKRRGLESEACAGLSDAELRKMIAKKANGGE